jgi:hypothetical protein
MRRLIIICAVLLCGLPALSQKREVAAQPNEFVIGRHTFFDIGPPFNFYELFIVQQPQAAARPLKKSCLRQPAMHASSLRRSRLPLPH